MKRLLLSTAVLGASALSAAAQDAATFRSAADPQEVRASDLLGMRVYVSEAAVEGDAAEGVQEGWEDVGEIDDLVLARDGSVEAVLVDVGGFLGLGERQVAVSMNALRFVADDATAEDEADFFLVMTADRAALEGAPDYGAAAGAGAVAATAAAASADAAEDVATVADEGAAVDPAEAAQATAAEVEAASADTAGTAEGTDPAAADAEMAVEADNEAENPVAEADAATETEMEADETAEAAADATGADEVAATDAVEPAVEGAAVAAARTPVTRDGFVAAAAGELTADALQGAAVYDGDDERIGEVSELSLSAEGQVEEVVVDVGGFLGIGEKPVSLAMTDIDILRADGGDEVRVYVSRSREELEALPTYAEE